MTKKASENRKERIREFEEKANASIKRCRNRNAYFDKRKGLSAYLSGKNQNVQI